MGRRKSVISISKLRAIVQRFDPGSDRHTREIRRRVLELLAQKRAALDRRNYAPGHVTASGLVLTSDRSRVLLVFHRRLGRWLQPGGHLEWDDTSAAGAAGREVREETGVKLRRDVRPALVGMGVHRIPASAREPAHLHFDLVWRFLAKRKRLGAGSHRERTVWCEIERLAGYGADGALLRSVRRAIRIEPRREE
ncbi:MAG: NUDIX domain-containing protein [Gemmatimonadetes bacterium]|nr:NUDIX domain-containing protein [Gemmatimonadota bacterium]